MLILRRGLAAIFDLAFVLSYLFSVSFTAPIIGFAPKNSPVLTALDFAFPLLYYGCLDSGFCGAGTIGKRLFGLEVHTGEGRTLRLYVSLARTVLKFGLPLLAFGLAGSIVFTKGFIGIAATLGAVVALPISVLVGRGAIGVHDRLLGTYVSRSGSKASQPREWRIYWPMTALATAAVAFPISAFITRPFSLKPTSTTEIVNEVEPEVEIAKEIMFGKGSEEVRPFVSRIEVVPSAWEFPTDYSKSYAKVPPEIVAELRGKQGAALIIVEVSEQAASQQMLRSAIIERIASAGAPLLVSPKDLPTFLWIAFAVKSTFGPLELTQADYSILILKRYRTNTNQLEIGVAEPSPNRIVAVGTAGPLVSGSLIHFPGSD
jgi:uncharacterized RDD family membrane protein YckC